MGGIGGRTPEEVCEQKVRFITEQAARMRIKRRRLDKYLDCYPCKICGGWHLTRKEGRTK